jgi:hypothetical protein
MIIGQPMEPRLGKDSIFFERAIAGLHQATELARSESDPEAAMRHFTRLARSILGDLDAGSKPGAVKPGDLVMLLAIETSKWKYAGNVLDWTAS